MSSGNDIFTGTNANDVFDGDAGSDTVTFAGDATGYRIDWIGNKVFVVDIDTSNGDTGTDTITGVESLQFADRTVGLDNTLISNGLTEVDVIAANSGSQRTPSITALSDGSYLLVWDAGGIYAQRYDANGVANGAATRLTPQFSHYDFPKIKPLANGGYAVLWSDSSLSDLKVQRYDANDVAVGTEFSAGVMFVSDPTFTPLAGGGYVMTWTLTQSDSSQDVEARVFNASGTAVDTAFTVNTTTSENQSSPAITALDDGGFLIVWESRSTPFGSPDICAQRFDANGDAVGDEILVYEGGSGIRPSVAGLTDGGYVVVWEIWGEDVAVNQYDADGELVISDTANTTTAGWQERPTVVALADGGYIVGWVSSPTDANSNTEGEEGDVYFQRYEADGDKVGAETRVNTTTAGWQHDVAIAALPDGGFVVSWTSSDDGSYGDVHSQRFDIDGNPVTSALQITGTTSADTLRGGEGAQILRGLAGADTLHGGQGDDIYVLNDADTVVEAASAGTDTVQAGISYTLVGNVENLTLTGSGAINGTGNTLANTVTGNSGANILNGATGADRLAGGLGNDTYITDGGDVITEAASAGNDTVQSSVGYTLGGNLENLRLSGSGAISGTGNALNNSITGNTGANALNGSTGNDTLNGGAGKDALTGGTGSDNFRFSTALSASTNLDTIKDFSTASDTIQLDNAIFKKLVNAGPLGAANFRASASGNAVDSNDYIVYETDTGKLFYDADGSGAGAKVQFALVGTSVHAALTAADFTVV